MNYLPLTFLALFLFFSSPAWAMGHLSPQSINSPLIGKPAPDVILTRSDGTSDNVIGSRQGKKAILIFWATWCSNCYEEMGTINDDLASIQQKGIKVILLDVGETTAAVKNYFNQRQMKLTSFVDEDSYLPGQYHLVGIPTLVFIDEKGIVRNVTHAFPSDYEDYFGPK